MMLPQVNNIMSGKVAGSSLSLPYQRAAVFISISTAMDALSTREDEFAVPVVTAILPPLLAAADKEVEDNTRLLAMTALGKVLRRSKPGIADAAAFFKSGLTKSKSSFVHYLVALIVATENTLETVDLYTAVVPALQTIVKDGMKKSSVGDADVALCVYLLLKMAYSSPSVLDGINFSKLFSSGGCICNSHILRMLQDEALGQFEENVRTSCASVLAESIMGIFIYSARLGVKEFDALLRSQSTGPFDTSSLLVSQDINPLDMWVAVVLVANRDVMSRMTTEFRALVAVVPAVAEKLVVALSSLLCAVSAHESGSRLQNSELTTGEDGSSLVNRFGSLRKRPHGSKVIEIMELLTVPSQGCAPHATLARLFICAHPIVSSSFATSMKLWRSQSVVASPLSDAVSRNVFQDSLLQLLTSEIQSLSTTARSCLQLLVADNNEAACEFINSIIVPKLLLLLKPQVYAEFSEEDQDLYLNPSKRTRFRGSVGVVVDESEVRITNADRAGKRGKFGGDLVEDEAWLEQIKAEKMKKLAMQKTAALGGDVDKKERDMDAKMDHMETVFHSMSCSMNALSAISYRPQLLSDCIQDVVDTFVALLRVSFVGDCALTNLTQLAANYYSEPADIAAALHAVSNCIYRPLKRSETLQLRFGGLVAVSAPIVRVLRRVHTQYVVVNKSVPPILVHLMLPFLHGIFLMPTMIPGCELAFSVLEACWSDDPVICSVKSTVIEICLRVIANFRIEHCDPEKLLIRILRGKDFSLQDIAPVLGDLGFLSTSSKVKASVLKALDSLPAEYPFEAFPDIVLKLWLLYFDDDEGVSTIAREMWDRRRLQLFPGSAEWLLHFLSYASTGVRSASAKAIAHGLVSIPSATDGVLMSLKTIYIDSLPVKVSVEVAPLTFAKSDTKSKVLMADAATSRTPSPKVDEKFPTREAIAYTIISLGSSKCLEKTPDALGSRVIELLTFVLQQGVVDEASSVCAAMLEAGRSIIDNYGMVACDAVLHYLNEVVSRTPSTEENLSEFDMRNEAGVVLLGAAGKHLARDDPNVLKITKSMLSALRTPSEQVQVAVAESLVGLISVLKGSEEVNTQLEDLISLSIEGSSYGG